MSLRRTCAGCGGTRRRAFWDTQKRERVIARCLDCGANFNGADVFIPIEWAGPAALGLGIDPGPEGAVTA